MVDVRPDSPQAGAQWLLAHLHSLGIRARVQGDRLALDAPKGVLTDALRALVGTHKADLLRLLREGPGVHLGIPRRTDRGPAPCSFAQGRLWFFDRLEGERHAYNIPLFFRALGGLDVEALRSAVRALVHRHESLRTVFRAPADDEQEPWQVILPDIELPMPLIDLSQGGQDQRERDVQAFARRSLQTPFDLASGPLLRLEILRLSRDEHVLLFNVHHSVFDGPSISVFLGELDALYGASCRAEPSPLPEREVQYGDFSVWQRARLTEAYLTPHLNFWREHLRGAPPVLALPTDRPRPPFQTYRGARIVLSLDLAVSQDLRALARGAGATPFMVFLAAWALLLSRHTQTPDIVVGTPIANRNHSALETMIGFLVNTLALRVNIGPGITFDSLLAQLKGLLAQAHMYQDLPFEKLVRAIGVERSPSYNALFQVMFVYQAAFKEVYPLQDVNLSHLDFDNDIAKFDLTLIVREQAANFSLILEYNTDLFERATGERMGKRLEVLLRAIATRTQLPVRDLPFFTEDDWRQIREWASPPADPPAPQTVVALFAEQAARTPDHLAVVWDGQSLTYVELDRQSDRIAHVLRSLQDAAGNALLAQNPRVALCLDRSLQLPVQLLGILKAGAAYVPIEPNHPEARIRHLLEDSAAPVVLTQRSLAAQLQSRPLRHPCRFLCLLDDAGCATEPAATSGERRPRSEDLAYIIYTSGSSGAPKGVLVEHRALAAHASAMRERYQLSAHDRVLQFASVSVDASVEQLWIAWLSGACAVMLKESVVAPSELVALIRDAGVTLLDLPPAYWQQVLELEPAATLPGVRTLILGGEALPVATADKTRRQFPDLTVYNAYGPTEAVVTATLYPLPPHLSDSRRGSVPIGTPRANTRCYLVGEDGQLLPAGIFGELCIGGDLLARGYLNQPALTAERFVALPLPALGRVERVYRSGDRARWLLDGNLEYAGRSDDQIKLRGFRIEPGEIESALLQHPDVQECAVLFQQATPPGGRLVAYVVLRQAAEQRTVPLSALRRHLEERLPAHMVPAVVVFLPALPLTPSGKIDRRALPEPDTGALGDSYLHPRDSLELRLSSLWERLLVRSPIGVRDDFFAMGGDSLLAIQLVSALNREFATALPLHVLFQHRTIEQLALVLRRDASALPSGRPLVGLQTRGTRRPIFCVHAAGGIVFRYIQVANLLSHKYGHPFYGLQAPGVEKGESPFSSIEEMAAAYVDEIRAVQPRGPYLLAGWSMGGTVAFEMARFLEDSGETVEALLMLDAPSPFSERTVEDDIDFLLERLRPGAGLDLPEIESYTTRDAKMMYILEQKKLVGLFAPDMDLAEAERRLRLHRHHNELCLKYRPGGPIRARTIFFKPAEKIPFDVKMQDPVSGWSQFVPQGLELHEAPGNHFNMFSQEHSPLLADLLSRCLAARPRT